MLDQSREEIPCLALSIIYILLVIKAVLRIRDVYPGSQILILNPSRISDLKTATKESKEKKICCHTFFSSHEFTKLKIILFLECWKKIGQFSKNYITLSQNFLTKLSKIWVWDPEKTYPGSGSRGQKGTGSRIPDPDPQNWMKVLPYITLIFYYAAFWVSP